MTVKAEYGGDKPLKLGEFEIPCYVLDNEKRVLVRDRMLKSLGMSGSGGKAGLDRLTLFAQGKAISPFVSDELAISIQNPSRLGKAVLTKKPANRC